MFRKALIANRGEIAVRIIRTLKEMNIASVIAYSQADFASMPVKMADQAICIGPASAIKSYLNIDAIIAAAKITDADAIHPGYGFLSENADFAQACHENGIKFIGPSAKTLRMLGNKSEARKMAMKAGIPITPGTSGCVSESNYEQEALKIGFPVMIKASAGGGGKGIRIARNEQELRSEFHIAASEALSAFGDNSLYFEKYIERPRHIEVQFVRDLKGNVLVFPERDCSIQRRHQKLIEESPSPAVSKTLREQLSEEAAKLANAANYIGAGTVEFLLDNEGKHYFMEVNARLQVEHPVTEAITGIDLVREQVLASAGETLAMPGITKIKPNGHAIEFRINAECPEKDFRPEAGTIKKLVLPGGLGVRTDTYLYAGYSLPVFYDSLLAKIIINAPSRRLAISRAERALRELETDGIKTTSAFCLRILNDEDYRLGKTDTAFIESLLKKTKHTK